MYKKPYRIMLCCMLFMLFCTSGISLKQLIFKYKTGVEEYSEIQIIASNQSIQIENEEPIDFKILKDLNPDVVAWIRFDEPSQINYPVVQGRDNEKYLTTTFKGYENTMGCIFINAYNKAEFSDKNTIIYGHRMKNGSMFKGLEQYKERNFWENYPYFYIYTPDGVKTKYHIYATSIVDMNSVVYTYEFENDKAFMSFIEKSMQNCFYETGISVDAADKIVTLSTCTENKETERLVVHGVRVEE